MNKHSALSLSQTDGRPMYLQIIEQISHKVAVGDWPAGSDLPSIRQLAADLCVSVITVKRAYQELERDGVILTQQGRGSIVSANANLSGAKRELEFEQALLQAARSGELLGLGPDAMCQRLRSAIDQLKES
jgi:GntR family transcriptional regulator